MQTPSKKPKPKELTLLTAPYWVFEGWKLTVSSYLPSKRPISGKRFSSLRNPNLTDPIFVIGAPRSGTTFLGDSLGQVSSISYHHEPVPTKAASRYVYERIWARDKAKSFYYLTYKWLMRYHLDADLRFAEKTPRNCHIIPFLADIFPQAKFVHIIRNGRGSAASHVKKPWFHKHQTGRQQYEPGGYPIGAHAQYWVERGRIEEFEATTDIHRCIWAWKRFVEAARKAGHQLSPERYCELRYESLVENPQTEGQILLDFLGIADTPSRNEFLTALEKSNTGSLHMWKEHLTAEDLSVIDLEAGPLLRDLGYI